MDQNVVSSLQIAPSRNLTVSSCVRPESSEMTKNWDNILPAITNDSNLTSGTKSKVLMTCKCNSSPFMAVMSKTKLVMQVIPLCACTHACVTPSCMIFMFFIVKGHNSITTACLSGPQSLDAPVCEQLRP